LLHHKSEKLKYFLERMNTNLASVNEFNALHGRTVRGIINAILFGLCVFVGNAAYTIYQDVQEYRFPREIVDPTTEALNGVVSKQVLYNDKLVNETAMLLQRLCDRPKIQYQTGLALGRLFRYRSILRGTDTLTKDYLHQNLLYDENIQVKFKNLIVRQLRDEKRRKDLLGLFVNFIRSETALNYAVYSVGNVMKMDFTGYLLTQNVKGTIHRYLSSPESMKNLKNKLDAYFIKESRKK